MYKTIFGFFLLFVGLAIIGFSLYSGYNVFFAKQKPPQIFKAEDFSLNQLEKQTKSAKQKPNSLPVSRENFEKMMDEMMTKQITKIFPQDLFLKILNLGSFSVFIGILILGGEKIASLGIKLLASNKKQA